MNVKVYIDSLVYQKVMYWVNKSHHECSGLGKVISENGIFRVVDAVMVPQKNGSTTTDIEPEDAGKAMFLLKDAPGDLNWWWHSHVNMGVFWSGTDRETIEKIGQAGWCLATVFNKKNEHRSALYLNSPYAHSFMPKSLFLDELPTQVFDPVSAETIQAWDAEYEKNVIKNESKANQGFWMNNQYGFWSQEEGKFVPAKSKKDFKRKIKQAQKAGQSKGGTDTSKSRLVQKLVDESVGHQGYRQHWPLDDQDRQYIAAQYGIDTTGWSPRDLEALAEMIDRDGWKALDGLTSDDAPEEKDFISVSDYQVGDL